MFLRDGFEIRVSWRAYGPATGPTFAAAVADGLVEAQQFLAAIKEQFV